MCRKAIIVPSFPGIVVTIFAAFCLLPFAAANAQNSGDDVRESTTLYYDKGGRARATPKTRTEDRFDGLEMQGLRTKPGRETASGKSSSTATAEIRDSDFWIYYADVELFYDDDDDGYFYGIDVLFDADTYYEVADVYAVLYLSYEGGPWNEYATTEPFSIYGATSDDEYVVVTELTSGYPTGSYDLLIELYDTYDGAFVADLGPEDNPDLGFLPLEDFNRDDPRRDSHRHRGGGAIDWYTALLLLAASLAVRSRGFRRRAG